MIVRDGLVAIEDIILAEPFDETDALDLARSMFADIQKIESTVDFFTSYMAYQEISQSSGSMFKNIVRRSREPRPSWALITDALLIHHIFRHESRDLCLRSEEQRDKVKVLHTVCVESLGDSCRTEGVDEARAHAERVSDLRKLDWRVFVERKFLSVLFRTLPSLPGSHQFFSEAARRFRKIEGSKQFSILGDESKRNIEMLHPYFGLLWFQDKLCKPRDQAENV
jgi:hypothetical protein